MTDKRIINVNPDMFTIPDSTRKKDLLKMIILKSNNLILSNLVINPLNVNY